MQASVHAWLFAADAARAVLSSCRQVLHWMPMTTMTDSAVNIIHHVSQKVHPFLFL